MEGPGVVPGKELVASGTGADRETPVLASVLGPVLGHRGAVSEVRVVGSLTGEVPVEVVKGPAGGWELVRVGALVLGNAAVRLLPAGWEETAAVTGFEEPVGDVALPTADVLGV